MLTTADFAFICLLSHLTEPHKYQICWCVDGWLMITASDYLAAQDATKLAEAIMLLAPWPGICITVQGDVYAYIEPARVNPLLLGDCELGL